MVNSLFSRCADILLLLIFQIKVFSLKCCQTTGVAQEERRKEMHATLSPRSWL